LISIRECWLIAAIVLLLQEQVQCVETAQFVDYPHDAADGCVEVAEVVDSSYDSVIPQFLT